MSFKSFIFIIFYLVKYIYQLSDINNIYPNFNEFIREKTKEILYDNIESMENECIKYYCNDNFLNKETYIFNVYVNYSSHNLNDLKSYYNCKEIENSNYYVFSFKPNLTEKKSISTIEYDFSYGICLVNISVCGDENIIDFLRKVAINTEIKGDKILYVYKMEYKKKYSKFELILTYIIPSILLLFIVLSIIPLHPIGIFRESFKLKDNASFLFEPVNFGNKNKVFNYIKGLQGINIVLAGIGIGYMGLEFKIFDYEYFKKNHFNPLKSIINVCTRYANKFLFSCSGYVFVYVFLCYLDEHLIKESRKYSINNKKFNKSESISQINDIDSKCESDINLNNEIINPNQNETELNEIDIDISNVSNKNIFRNKRRSTEVVTDINRLSDKDFNRILKPETIDQSLISWETLIHYFLRQLYKLIIIVLFILFLRYCFFVILDFIGMNSPFLKSFQIRILNNISPLEIIGRLFQYQNIIDFFNIYKNISYEEKYIDTGLLILHWQLICEIFFFIFTAPIVFYAYKYKKNITFIFLVMFLVFVVLKFVRFILSQYPIYSTLFFYSYGNFYSLNLNPIYNYSYYIIGCLFGVLYYTLQKMDEEKEYLNIAYKIIMIMRFQKKIIYYISVIVIGIIGVLLVFFEQILFMFKYIKLRLMNSGRKSDIIHDINLDKIYKNKFLNYFYLFDTDLFIFLMHYFFLLNLIKGEKVISGFLSKKTWEITPKIYFGFIIFANFTVHFVIYKKEDIIPVDIMTLLYYGILSGFVSAIIIFIYCLFIEIPLKKMTSLLSDDLKKLRKRN